ncbi:uncharacterized protein LOC135383452 [Ornithodoros turicata]|uniref:uncharacterized protein LOC135383452 n=1 Tax=Ornithodoros turicata TaxID=34597 RepID=UPI003138EFF8
MNPNIIYLVLVYLTFVLPHAASSSTRPLPMHTSCVKVSLPDVLGVETCFAGGVDLCSKEPSGSVSQPSSLVKCVLKGLFDLLDYGELQPGHLVNIVMKLLLAVLSKTGSVEFTYVLKSFICDSSKDARIPRSDVVGTVAPTPGFFGRLKVMAVLGIVPVVRSLVSPNVCKDLPTPSDMTCRKNMTLRLRSDLQADKCLEDSGHFCSSQPQLLKGFMDTILCIVNSLPKEDLVPSVLCEIFAGVDRLLTYGDYFCVRMIQSLYPIKSHFPKCPQENS